MHTDLFGKDVKGGSLDMVEPGPAPDHVPHSPALFQGKGGGDPTTLADLFSHYADPGAADLKHRYQAQAFAQLGVSEAEFSSMSPIERNGLINAAYARMYKSDPDSMKWAGMAAMASNEAGTGMFKSYLLKGVEVAGLGDVTELAGGPTGDKVESLLASGNAGIFNDMYWQHLAFQQGGLGEMEKAAKEGSITPEQLEGWRRLARGRAALNDAKASGDRAAIEKAQADIWAGNTTLLHAEQGFVQGLVYDESEESRSAFQFVSGNLNPLGVPSPVPGGTDFKEHRMRKSGADDVGDFDQRWGWIEENMLPEYKEFEGNRDGMMARMDTFIAREHEDQLLAKKGELVKDGLFSMMEYESRVEDKAGEAAVGVFEWAREQLFGVEEGAPNIDLHAREELGIRSSSVAYEDAPPPAGR